MRMKAKGLVVALAFIALAGCQTPAQGPLWRATGGKDEFTDKETRMVTVGEYRLGDSIVTRSFRFYPFVGSTDGQLYVGIRSGGKIRVPAGTVQIRIDDNPAWTIEPSETPLVLAPKTPQVNGFATPEQAANFAAIQASVADNVRKMTSPYTAATGDKARAILKEMLAGKVIKFRQVGINQAASTTGVVNIDESFPRALSDAGILLDEMK